MKKLIKGLLIFTAVIGALFCALVVYSLIITRNYNLDKDKLVNLNNTISFFDNNGEEIYNLSSKKSNLIKIEELPDYVINSFIAVEDKRFYSHNGIDYRSLLRAGVNNIKSFSLKEGASTISQQLIKNTHLSGEKTLKRKIIEFKLTKQLEREYSKKEILEKYLNTIYFGENSFGIENASKKYFNKSASELTIEEASCLAGIIKAPNTYSPIRHQEKCLERRNIVLKLMYEQGYLNESEYNYAINTSIELNIEKNDDNFYDYIKKAETEMETLLSYSPYEVKNFKVYLYLDKDLQNKIAEYSESFESESEKQSIILDNKNYSVLAYYSTLKASPLRQIGSTIKPLLSYAPAIDQNIVNESTPILDEKMQFNDYSPSNYNDKYYGYISVNKSLEKSSNIVAIKLLNMLGIDKGIEYLNELNINTKNEDNNLSLALGALTNGTYLENIVSAYTVFANNGNYSKCNYISQIKDSKNKVIYTRNIKNKQVFKEETATIMNYMLGNVVKNGTAKKLSGIYDDIAGKTGTVGNDNGNTDAYSISYNNDYSIGVWLGNKDNKLLDNKITGGGLPSSIARKIWENIKQNYPLTPLTVSQNVNLKKLDKIYYDENNLEKSADENSPDNYIIEGYISDEAYNKLEKSTRFSSPFVEKPNLLVKYNQINISLCQIEYYNYEIFRESNGKKIKVFDSINQSDKYHFADTNLSKNMFYSYYLVPYYVNKNKEYYGKEIFIGKIKTPITNEEILINDDWWKD